MSENMPENMSESYIEVELTQQPIELYKLLKIANLVSGGGEAKVVISEGYVFLNGEVEYQKRKKIYHEDVIEFNGETLQLIINENPIINDEDDLTGADLANETVNELVKESSNELLTNTVQGTSSKPEKRNKKAKPGKKKPKQASAPKEFINEYVESEAPLPRKRKPISF